MAKDPQLTKGERTRRTILDKAENLFLSQGFAATSMRQIAQAVGITPAAIYNHFSGKDEIFTTLLQEVAPFEQAFALFEETEADTPEDLLHQMVRSMVDLMLSHEDYIQLGLIDAQERNGATLITFLPQLYPRFMAFYQRIVALDADRGRLRDIPTPIFMRTLISLMFGYLITERVATPAETLNLPDMDWVQGLVDIFLHGVLKAPNSDV
jgi:AcrR family transcriptional regulator